jgi:hypothetical protein
MVELNDVIKLMNDRNVISIKLLKYLQNNKCFIDFELNSGKKLQDELSAEAYDSFDLRLEDKGDDIRTKKIK